MLHATETGISSDLIGHLAHIIDHLHEQLWVEIATTVEALVSGHLELAAYENGSCKWPLEV